MSIGRIRIRSGSHWPGEEKIADVNDESVEGERDEASIGGEVKMKGEGKREKGKGKREESRLVRVPTTAIIEGELDRVGARCLHCDCDNHIAMICHLHPMRPIQCLARSMTSTRTRIRIRTRRRRKGTSGGQEGRKL